MSKYVSLKHEGRKIPKLRKGKQIPSSCILTLMFMRFIRLPGPLRFTGFCTLVRVQTLVFGVVRSRFLLLWLQNQKVRIAKTTTKFLVTDCQNDSVGRTSFIIGSQNLLKCWGDGNFVMNDLTSSDRDEDE